LAIGPSYGRLDGPGFDRVRDREHIAARRKFYRVRAMSSDIHRLTAAATLAVAIALTTASCGLAGTAASTAASGVSEAQQAEQAKSTEDRVKQQVQDALRTNAQQREQAEQSAQ
jgi:hypothetical protein